MTNEEIERIASEHDQDELNDSRQDGYVTSTDIQAFELGIKCGLRYARDRGLLSPKGELTYVMSKDYEKLYEHLADGREAWCKYVKNFTRQTDILTPSSINDQSEKDLKALWASVNLQYVALSSGEQPIDHTHPDWQDSSHLTLEELKNEVMGEQPQQEPVAWTGSGSLEALKVGLEGYIYSTEKPSHPIPLYSRPTPKEGEELVRAVQSYLAKQVDRPIPTDPADFKRELMVMRVSMKNAINNLQDWFDAALPKDTGGTTLQR